MTDVADYDYDLPKRLIAQQPLANRSDARLMTVDREQQTLTHSHIRDLPEILSSRDCLVLNDSRVVPARLVGYRTNTNGHWEGLFLSADDTGRWKILGKARGRLQVDETITLVNSAAKPEFRLRLLSKEPTGAWWVRPEPLSPEPASSTWQLLDRVGRVPLPHYIRHGEMVDSDWNRYQTVFASEPGSVAAPTAGLHFTPELLKQVHADGTGIARVTLHVGIGTFKPIATDTLDAHQMHSEWASVSEKTCEAIAKCRAGLGRVVAVGTTSMRTLESAAKKTCSPEELARPGRAIPKPWSGETDLFIRPGYQFSVVNALLTNFHLPRSTLLVLVRTFGGEELIRRAYQEAIDEDYRFFSYGDAMLIV